jgi:DNA-binding IclR family transcriptional regulator
MVYDERIVFNVGRTFLSDQFAELWKLIDLLVRKDFRQANLDSIEEHVNGSGMQKQVAVKSVKKALDALDFVIMESISKDGVSLGEIASHLGIQNTTAHNILKTMEVCGYISRAEGRLYSPGAKCRQLTRAGAILRKLLDAAKPLMAELAEKTGESFVLTTLLNGERHVLFRAKGGGMISVESEKADNPRLYGMVTTRVMLAFAHDNEVDFFMRKNGMPGNDWNGINDIKNLNEEFLKIRKSGFAEEKKSELAALSVPLMDADGFLLGALGAYVPSFRFNREKKDILIDTLKKASQKISQMILHRFA